MPVKRPGCTPYDDETQYRNGARYSLVKRISSMEWAKKVAWDKIDWDRAKGVNDTAGGYYIRTNVMNSIRMMMGDADPFPNEEWRQAMLIKIPAGSSLVIHNDGVFKYAAYDRYHVPIATNDGCKCFLHRIGTDPEEFDAYHCEVGSIYLMDPTILHYSENLGETDRIHLCIDLKVKLDG